MIRQVPGGVRLTLRLQPRASHNKVMGVHGNAIKVAITAPPVEGKANKHVIRFLARLLGVPQSAVTIVSGELARDKVVEVMGVDPEQAAGKLGVQGV
ncbi:MAG: DUF167 domain-containing protein [Leptospirillia bacterium]